MSQILITGMHRSGTTLCLDLLRRHPEISFAINEGVLFERGSGELIQGSFPSYPLDDNKPTPTARPGQTQSLEPPEDPYSGKWVAKMSYPGPMILQQWCDTHERYLRCWLTEFAETARILHIIRHPFAVFDSIRRRWAADPIHLQNYGAITLDAVCRDWANAVRTIDLLAAKDTRIITVLYEDLVASPQDTLASILHSCALEANLTTVDAILNQDLVFFGQIDKTRAEVHKTATLEAISRSTSWLLTPLFEKWGYADR